MKTVASLLLVLGLSLLFGCSNPEVKAVRAMPISHIDLSQVRDGIYNGDFSYGGFTYVVKVTVANHEITDVAVAKNRDTKYAKMAESVLKRIMEEQKNDVDAVSGATTTSKALLKAVEKALEKGM